MGLVSESQEEGGRPRRETRLTAKMTANMEADSVLNEKSPKDKSVKPGRRSDESKAVQVDSPLQSEDDARIKRTKKIALSSPLRQKVRMNTTPVHPIYETIEIYHWEKPQPRDFTQLGDYNRKWKSRTDEREKEADIDDGADDWTEVSGTPEDYEDQVSMHRVFASVTINKAKRAFWAGKSFDNFEAQELQIDSEASGGEISNEFRREIFCSLRTRLCEEIWSHACPSTLAASIRTSKVAANIKTSTLAANIKTPSPVAKPNNPDDGPRKKPRLEEPTVAESKRGITGWAIDTDGTRQPLYGDEKEAPNMHALQQEMRERNKRDSKALGVNAVNRRAYNNQAAMSRVGGVDLNGNVSTTWAHANVLGAEPDFETSEEEV